MIDAAAAASRGSVWGLVTRYGGYGEDGEIGQKDGDCFTEFWS